MVSNSARKKAAREHQLLHGGTYASALAAVKKIEASVPSLSSWTLSRMIEDGVLSDGTAAFLEHCVAVGRVVVIAGPIGSGRNALLNALVRGIREDARVGIVARGDWKGLDELVPHLNNAVVAEVPSGLTPSLDWEFSLSRQQLEYLVVDEIIEPGDGHFFTRFVSENVCGRCRRFRGRLPTRPYREWPRTSRHYQSQRPLVCVPTESRTSKSSFTRSSTSSLS